MSRQWSGERTRQLRKRCRLTQAEVAAALGVQRSTVITWEQGEHPQLRYAAGLADLLGASLDELFAHTPDADTPATAGEESAA